MTKQLSRWRPCLRSRRVFVARPFLRSPGAARPAEGPTRWTCSSSSVIRLLEERDRALAALKELEFDHRTGKVSDDDYRELVGPLRRQAADALRALETGESGHRQRPRADVHS